MIIKKLVLHRFKRFFLTNIETLTFTPENKISVILAGNGTGKSQLLSQLTPLPANINKDFKEGGYKYIEIMHHNRIFKLTSGVDGSKKHSFIIDDVEYNTGGTITVQNNLVKEYFNITPHIQQVLIGNNVFTNMSVNERKRWITEISNIDYSFPISVYNKLKARHRDILGGIKLYQEEIVKTETMVLSKEEVDSLNNDIKHLEKFIEHITMLVDTNVNEVVNIEEVLNNSIEKYRVMYSKNKDILTADIEVMKIRQGILNNTIKDNKIKISNMSKDIDRLNYIEKHVDEDTVIAKINSLNRLLEDKKKNMMLGIDIDEIALICDVYNNTYIETIELLSKIKELDSYDGKRLEEYKNKLDIIYRKIRTLENNNSRLRDEIKHMVNKEHDDNKITCVNCNHEWHLGYDKNYITVREKMLEDNVKSLELLIKDKDKIEDVIKHTEEKLYAINSLRNIISSNSNLKKVWGLILNDINIYHNDGNELYNRYTNLNMNFKEVCDIPKILEELHKYEMMKKEIDIKKEMSKEMSNKNKDMLLKNIENMTIANREYLEELNKISILIEQRKSIDELLINIKKYVKEWYNNKNTYSVKLRNVHLKELIHEMKILLLEATNKINKSKSILDKLTTDKKNLDMYKEKEKVLKLMLKELSPTEGLIAKSISSFLNMFLEDINKLINSVWNYEIKLLPSDITEDNDLDYKFKVMVDNREVIEDISKTSSSMQEIINLAFRIMFIKYMKFEEYPLILDEFGRTFDAEHRVSAYNIIDRIISSKFSQIFMVSHFESMYGRFVNADMCVLNGTGVDLSNIDRYNTTMKLERE